MLPDEESNESLSTLQDLSEVEMSIGKQPSQVSPTYFSCQTNPLVWISVKALLQHGFGYRYWHK